MTKLEKALIERLTEMDESKEKMWDFNAEQFDEIVRLSEPLGAMWDHIKLDEADGKRFVYMEVVYESAESTDFHKIYEYFKSKFKLEEEQKEEAE